MLIRTAARNARGRRAAARPAFVEPLESRVLMSGTTEDDFQLAAGQRATASGMAELGGSVFAAGNAADASGATHGVIRQRTVQADGNVQWDTIVDYRLAEGTCTTSFYDLCADPAGGALYAAGQGQDNDGEHWIVVKATPPPAGSTDHTWSVQTVDRFQLTAGYSASAGGLTWDARGDLVVVGSGAGSHSGRKGSITRRWVVRELTAEALAQSSLDGSAITPASWNTVQNYAHEPGYPAHAMDVAVAPPSLLDHDNDPLTPSLFGHQDVFVVGRGDSSTNGEHWLTHKGRIDADGNVTWESAPVDDYKEDPNSTRPSGAMGLGVYDNGSGYDVYVVGTAYADNGLKGPNAGAIGSWVVRQGAYDYDGAAVRTQTWQEVDRYRLVSGGTATSRDVAISGSGTTGSVYVTGSAQDANKVSHAIIRGSDASGRNWATLDDWQLDPTKASLPITAFVNADGNLFTAGQATTSSGAAGSHWFVRRIDTVADEVLA